jgi:hypothetical protein
MKLKFASLFLIACLVGCADSVVEPKKETAAHPGYGTHKPWTPPPEPTHYKLEMTSEQVSTAYLAHWEKRQIEKQNLGVSHKADLAAIASDIKTYYAKGLPEVANSLIQADSRGYAWDQAQDIFTVSCVYQPSFRGGDMRLKVTFKEQLAEDIVVCFPPGLYGKSLDPQLKVQDLGILEAPVIQVRSTTETRARVTCMTFGAPAPDRKMTYTLHRIPSDDGVYQLLVEICAGDFDGPEIQLAVWIVGNKLGWKQFNHGRSFVTFEGERISDWRSKGAADLIIKSGVDPATTPYFGGKGEPARLKPPELPKPVEVEKPEPVETGVSG